jgi:hypothetical protein
MDKPHTASQPAAEPAEPARKAPAAPPRPGKPAEKKPAAAKPVKWTRGKEIRYVLWSCVGTFLGGFFFLGCLGFLVGSHYLVGVIQEIGAEGFTEQMDRIDHYESFFDALRMNGYKVLREDPEIDQGVIYYLWQVTPPGSDESRVFRWRHDLATSAVAPLNNPALLLDVKLGYVTGVEAGGWKFNDPGQKFDPGDALVQAMVNNDFSMINPTMLANSDGSAPVPPSGPVGDPLINPDKASGRGGGSASDEDKEGAEGEGEGKEGEPGATQPVEPGTPQDPGAGGGETPPDKPAEPGGNGGKDPGADPGAGGGNGGGSDPGAGDATEVH